MTRRSLFPGQIRGSFSDTAVLATLRRAAPRAIIHLAAVVSGAAEADFDLGMEVNLAGFLELLEGCRGFPVPPLVLFSSSVAVFSCTKNNTINENCLSAPMSSYGAQKLMGEIILRDVSRRGFVRGRALRFPTISVRPGKPNKAASSFASGIIRAPLAEKPRSFRSGAICACISPRQGVLLPISFTG